jgi:predicted alpha/beta-hydrolase family hydrolase
MLFLSGTRDELADLDLLRPVCEGLGNHATLHLLDTADHGFKVQKRSRPSEEDVFVEMARVTNEWTTSEQALSPGVWAVKRATLEFLVLRTLRTRSAL